MMDAKDNLGMRAAEGCRTKLIPVQEGNAELHIKF